MKVFPFTSVHFWMNIKQEFIKVNYFLPGMYLNRDLTQYQRLFSEDYFVFGLNYWHYNQNYKNDFFWKILKIYINVITTLFKWIQHHTLQKDSQMVSHISFNLVRIVNSEKDTTVLRTILSIQAMQNILWLRYAVWKSSGKLENIWATAVLRPV